jgi:hypothetical protein
MSQLCKATLGGAHVPSNKLGVFVSGQNNRSIRLSRCTVIDVDQKHITFLGDVGRLWTKSAFGAHGGLAG